MSERLKLSSIMRNSDIGKELAVQRSKSGELVDYEPKDEDDDCDTEAITKEEEWITKRKTELTTTRQIETRVKRQVVLEDGKVVEDSGPIVSTNTTEDTDKQETETTEKRDLGIPDKNHPPQQSVTQGALEDGSTGQLLAVNGTVVTKLLARPQDGLVRETNEKRIVSHEEIKDYLETEDVRHLGDFSDETYINAVNKAENLQEVLLSAAQHKSLVPTDPRIIVNTSKSRKTVDTEDLLKRSFAQPDGTLVTETKNTTEHEVIIDEELPDKDDHSAGSHERITTVEARQRFFKQRDEQNVDLVANGKVIGTEMRYAAETMQLEKDGSLERAGDWDSLSDRMRKLRKPQKSLLQQQKEAALMADRKDALTKRPLDFDREEETRKGETMKWLESHFGSESTASNDSREDTEVEPTKRTFFNVTIKSNHAPNEGPSMDQHLGANALDKEYQKKSEPPSGVEKTQYFQGISNWTERKHLPTNHFATKAFREDLRETVERNRLKKSAISGSRDQLSDSIKNISDPRDNYVSRADILHQKRQSLSSQFLAKSKRESVDKVTSHNDPLDYKSGSQTDIRYMGSEDQKRFQTNAYSSSMFMLNEGNRNEMREPRVDYSGGTGRRKDYEVGRVRNSIVESDHVPKYTFETYTLRKESRIPSPDHMQMQTKTLDRPTVPQRKRLAERKLRQQMSAPPETTGVFEIQNKRAEPPPDYSPPPRSRSASPQIDYIIGSENKTPRSIAFDSGTSNVGTARKLHQRTRFAPTSLPPHSPVTQYSPRPKMSTQTTQTTPSNISSSTATSHKSNKVGQVIGNSIRKLVSKIRSASAERKFRMKSKSKSREQSPSTQNVERTGDVPQSTTYQQYNLIDSHIGDAMNGHQFEFDTMKPSYSMSNLNKREPSVHSGSTTQNREKSKTVKHSQQAELYSNQREIDSVVNPRQRYYLGEDPYSSTLYGKENMHDVSAVRNRSREMESTINRRNYRDSVERERPEKDSYMRHRNISSNTLGRYQKSSQRLAGSTPNLSNEYRSTKTLPRKLPDHHEYHQEHEESELDGRTQYQTAPTTTGPAKPARAYSKSLSRSKSFNIHGLNGSMENTAIYIENLGGKQNNHHVSNSNYAYRKDPYVGASSRDNSMLQSGLKSPSIVNLISRSQKDLTKLDLTEGESEIYDKYADKDTVTSDLYRGQEDKRKVFLKGLHQQAPDLYHTLHGDGHDLSHESSSKYPLKAMHSLQSRPSVQLNKDTASIIRGGVVRTEHQHPSLVHKEKHQLYVSDQRRRGSNATIIEVNRK